MHIHRHETKRLPDRLHSCAEIWTEATGKSLAALGRAAVNDSSFFRRLGSPQGVTTQTLERFATFLAEPANWPGEVVPEEVAAFAHVTGITAEDHVVSTGQIGHVTGHPVAPAPFGSADIGERGTRVPLPDGGRA